jgi:hypothetical protein
MARARRPPSPGPGSLLAELKAVHALLRRDLASVRRLAAGVANGSPPGDVRAGVRQLQAGAGLVQLRTNCIKHCHAVHGHHEGEDTGLFRSVRRVAPDLRSTIDRLQADHRAISDLLDQVEGIARTLDQSGDSRSRLVGALDVLAARLLEHLDVEEQVLAPVLRTMSPSPDGTDRPARRSRRR